MSLATLDQTLLRILTSPPYSTKGSEKTWVEEDQNYVRLANAIKDIKAIIDSFQHDKNEDDKLSEGTANEITSAQLKPIVTAFRKDNMGALLPPTENDDGTLGYKPFSLWMTVANSIFINKDNTNNNAVWVCIFGSGD